MELTTKINSTEFRIMQEYIEKNCGIRVNEDKIYLIETRLTTLMVENGCKSFTEFHLKARADRTNKLRDKIIDAMTTNETLWFRDKTPFVILKENLLKEFTDRIKTGKNLNIKIWCAASSTGQEPYSIAITIDEFCRQNPYLKPEQVKIIATDISPTVLYLAMAGRYDSLSISRGLPEDIKLRYFTQKGKVWCIKDEIKRMVTFKKLNLQEPFSSIGKMDIVFCRNVLIYFSDEFKKDILRRIGNLVKPDGYLFLGASESIINYTNEYKIKNHSRGLYYQIK